MHRHVGFKILLLIDRKNCGGFCAQAYGFMYPRHGCKRNLVHRHVGLSNFLLIGRENCGGFCAQACGLYEPSMVENVIV